MADAITDPNSRPAAACPPLAAGDVLSADQYWARYAASPPGIAAERINRKVYLMSPLKAATHGDPHALLSLWLGTYASEVGGLIVSDNPTIRLNVDNDPQPDLCMRRVGGKSRLDEDGYLVGTPEMVLEVAASSASYDLGEKREIYEAAGVQEYLVYEAFQGAIHWWRLAEDRFVMIGLQSGLYRSNQFPGLWLDPDALRQHDSRRLLRALGQGLHSIREQS